MKILRKYIIREYVPPFLFGIAIFTFIFFSGKMVGIANLIVNKGVGTTMVLKLLLYSLPSTLMLTVPMGTLLAAILSLGRLASDNEITAIKAGGINPVRILFPILASGCAVSALLAFLYAGAIPFCNNKFVEQTYQIANKKPVLELQENAFNNLGEIRIYIHRINQKTNKLEDLIISENKPGSSRFITAQEGTMVIRPDGSKLTLLLVNGSIHTADENDRNRYQALSFNYHNITINLPKFTAGQRQKSIEEMTVSELGSAVRNYGRTSSSVSPFLTEFYKRSSLPFACLSFTLLGIPIGLRTKRRSKSIGFGISVACIFSYYLFFVAAETMGSRGTVPPFAAMWMPNIIFGIIGSVLFVKAIR